MRTAAELRPAALYVGGIALFTFLAWLFRVNLVIGLAITPSLFHLAMAAKALRVVRAPERASTASVYRIVAGREILAALLFMAAAGYIALRMDGSPRRFWFEAAIVVMLVGYVVLARLAAGWTGEAGRDRPPGD